jgi:hypothetical protein
MMCIWCRGAGKIKLIGYGYKPCPNCHGSGEGKDGGGDAISGHKKPYMLGNKHWIKRKGK